MMADEPKTLRFTKMAGTGNDFIVFDNRSHALTGHESHFLSRICQRRTSVGADGILLIERGDSAPVRMRYFNKDGHESTMCGNGARCAAYFAWKHRMVSNVSFQLEAMDGVHQVRIEAPRVTLKMLRPREFKSTLGILRESGFEEGGFVDTGVPHYVIFVPDVDAIDVGQIGTYYRHHDYFTQGSNVNFVQRLGENRIRVRTFERGVEEETLSCGTGSVASALITAHHSGFTSPITVVTRGGDLAVRFDGTWQDIFLTGPVRIVYEGQLFINAV